MNRQQKISIKIADVAAIPMTINSEDEELVRTAEFNVNRLWKKWRDEFAELKSSKEIIAMVAYQFAKSYYQLMHNVEDTYEVVDEFEAELDRLLELSTDAQIEDEINNNASK